MARQSEVDELTAAWRALDRSADSPGWQVIELAGAKPCAVMAGRRGSGNEESLLIGIPGISLGKDSNLPRGRGFLVVHAEVKIELRELAWLGVIRQPSGQLPLFALMAADLITLIRGICSAHGSVIYARVLSRIKAWQRFMSQDRPQVLSAEQEVGLVGELVVLENLISDGMQDADVIEAWEGPEDGLHDFKLGTGGLEVKTTLAASGFIARIGSLDQLDNTLVQPLYVGSVRLTRSDEGRTLPKIVDDLMASIAGSGAEYLFEGKLAAAGFLFTARDLYSNQFLVRELNYRLVAEECPRLTRSNVPAQVLDARYSLDLEGFPVVASTFSDISVSFGILK